jgi:multidrug resistance protein, MATE family
MSTNTASFRDQSKALMKLAWPLIGSQVAMFAIGLTDAIMLGWYSLEAFAAQVLGGSLFFIVLILGSGFAFGLQPMVANAHAKEDDRQIRRSTRMGFWLVLIYGAITVPILLFAETLLIAIGQDPTLSSAAHNYLAIMAFSIFPALMVNVLRSYLSALEQAGIILYVTLISLVVNAFINYLLIFGNWGFPEMGLRGAAVASFATHTTTFIILALYAAVKNRHHSLFLRFWRPDPEAFWQVFTLGWPIGVTVLAEVGMFTAASVMVGWVGVVELGAHGIALQVASLTFMFHLGLSHAVTVRAGAAHGRDDWEGVRAGARVALTISVGFSAVACVAFIVFPELLLRGFVSPNEPNLEALLLRGTTLLYIAAAFQLADGLQVMGTGLLRGLQDTKVPMYFATFSYWAIGVTAGYILGFVVEWDAVGVWLGLTGGLISSAILMLVRFQILSRGPA